MQFRKTKLGTGIILALLLALAASCSLSGGGLTDATIGGINNPGPGDGSHPFAFTPPVAAPPVEAYAGLAAPSGSVPAGWLLNCVETLPSRTNIDAVYQNPSLKLWADQIFDGVNAMRRANGLAPVQREIGMTVVAQAHARDMALRHYFDHTSPEGIYVWDRWAAVGVPDYKTGGENLAAGHETVSELLNDWATSQKHRENILVPGSTHAGVGVYFDDANYNSPIHITLEIVEYKTDPALNDWTFRAQEYLDAR